MDRADTYNVEIDNTQTRTSVMTLIGKTALAIGITAATVCLATGNYSASAGFLTMAIFAAYMDRNK